ncbi:3-oxoacyl-ACP reductase FabG [Streptomyces sp. NPDC059651]|uniref:3-oxoacyl-ACP reductase FabG n=1 Tax=unclassified Streptomyces TaxID=2593676 RepID=UPI0036A8EFFA
MITGGSRGIGASIAKALAGDGHRVAVNYRKDAEGAERVVAEIVERGGAAASFQADVSDEEAVDRLFGSVEQELGPVSVLVGNAGRRIDGVLLGVDTADWREVLDTNLSAAFYTTRRALGPMARAQFGRIIILGSLLGDRTLPGMASYSASKAGLEGFARSVALEVAHRGITVNVIAPGLVDTEFVDDLDLTEEWIRNTIPVRRAARPDEISSCARFLASAEAGYITGSTIAVDGGLSCSAFSLPRRNR